MELLQTLGLALGASFASGLNLYATATVLGLLHRYNVVELPGSLEILAHPAVLIVAIALYVVEFVADKIPYVDTLWDALHTFIRPPAAGLLAYAAFGDVPEGWRTAAGLLAGGVALTSHGTKASTRAAANTSPEPFSNSLLSLGEDGIAIFLAWMAAEHPILTIFLVVSLLGLSVYLILRLFRFLRQAVRRVFSRTSPVPASDGPGAISPRS
jgi:hypothetical protein